MSSRVMACELCGWHDPTRQRRLDRCPRCLQIEEMYPAWMTVSEIGKRLGMTTENVRYVVRRLELKRRPCDLPCVWMAGQDPEPQAKRLRTQVAGQEFE